MNFISLPVRVKSEFLKELDAKAKEMGLTRSALARHLLTVGLNQVGQPWNVPEPGMATAVHERARTLGRHPARYWAQRPGGPWCGHKDCRKYVSRTHFI
jgi:hypothetical protein